jgi:hypothetical protein
MQGDLSVEVLRAQAALQQCSTDLEKHRWDHAQLLYNHRTVGLALSLKQQQQQH